MRSDEYTVMFSVEDDHYWYRGLRAMLDLHWQTRIGSRPARVADIGCGTGAVLAHLAGHGTGWGLDAAPEAIAHARRRHLPRLCQGSALALPWPDAAFDAVTLFDVLYHRRVPDPLVPLQEARRVLAPGGWLFVNVPAYQWLYSSHDEAVHTARRFTRPVLTGLLREAGFETISATYWNSVLFPAIVAVRLWRSRHPETGSDLAAVSPAEQVLGQWALAAERQWLRWMRLPFGLSIFAAAQRPAER